MVDTKAVSVRLPLDLLNELNSYATDKGMVRGGEANIGGAIISILREHFGKSDNVVKQKSDSVGIEAMVNNAIESRLEVVLKQVEDLRLDLHSVKTNDLITKNLQANLTVVQQRIEALEAIAATTAKLESKLSLEIDKIDIRLKAMPDDLEAKLDPIRAQLVSLESRSEATENSKKPMLSVMRAA